MFVYVARNAEGTVIDWAYLEDWCRRLTGSFSDVYVFTVPLYLPKLDNDGKWRVVSAYDCSVINPLTCFYDSIMR